MAGTELQRHRRNLTWKKILTGGAAAVFFALVNMMILPGAELEVLANQITSDNGNCIIDYSVDDQNLNGANITVDILEVSDTDEINTCKYEAESILKLLQKENYNPSTNLDLPIYDIKIFSDGLEVTPEKKVTVNIKLAGATYSVGDSITIIHFTADGLKTVKGTVTDFSGTLYMSFDTMSFSKFMITDETGVGSNIWIVETGDELRRAINETSADLFAGTVIIDAKGDGKEFDITYPDGVGAPELNKNLTINLNSHYITVNGTFVDVKNGATLTITDNVATDDGSDVTGKKSAYGNKATYDSGNKKLTYYVTETGADSTGITTETVTEHVVTGCGVITATKADPDYAVFYVNAANLIINGGMIANSQSCAVNMVGSSTLELNGGYICGNNRLGERDGGAIRADGSCTIDMSGAVIAGNIAQNGGAIDIKGVNSKLLISGGVISGNQAVVNGGGIVSTGIEKFEITGGYITNNIASIQDNNNENGGGGIILYGDKKLILSGGFVTGNHAASGGGIYAIGSGAELVMNGGYITANHAVIGEGGGIRVGAGALADFNAGYITNNETKTDQHWGGGGIFIAEGAYGYAEKVLVKENTAGGFGGGVAGCSTGQIYMSPTNGIAIYSNKAEGDNLSGGTSAKHDDHSYAKSDSVFMENKAFQDYFSMLYSHIADNMLGGGYHNWSGSIDGQRIGSEIVITQGGTQTSNSVAGLKSNPTKDHIGLAEANNVASVYVTGNTSNTHGGGILCNGYMIFGTRPDEITASTRLEVHGTVQYLNWASNPITMTDNQFAFQIASSEDFNNIITTGSNYANGEITFKHRLTFASGGKYEYFVQQTTPDFANGEIDRAKYKVTVEVLADEESTEIPIPEADKDKDHPEKNTIKVSMRKIKSVLIEKWDDSSNAWTNQVSASVDTSIGQYNHAVAISLIDPANPTAYSFTNYNLTPPPPAADDSTNNSQPVTPTEPANEEVLTKTAEGELPQTGQNWMSVILLACAGCVCLIIGIVLKRVEHEWD